MVLENKRTIKNVECTHCKNIIIKMQQYNTILVLYIQEMIMLIRTKASTNVSFTIDSVSENLTVNKYSSNAKSCNVSLHSIYCSSRSGVVSLFWFPLKRNMKQFSNEKLTCIAMYFPVLRQQRALLYQYGHNNFTQIQGLPTALHAWYAAFVTTFAQSKTSKDTIHLMYCNV